MSADQRQDLLAGFHAVGAALKHDAEHVSRIWADIKRTDGRMRDLLTDASRLGITVIESNRAELDRLASNARHQGVLAEYQDQTQRYRESDLPDLLAQSAGVPLLLVLDGVQDPHNLGACLRTAAAAGATAVLAPADRAASLTPTARKVASGGAEIVPFVPVKNLARALQQLKRLGVWVIGATGEATARYCDADMTVGCALVLGGEDKGLRQLTQKHSDSLVAIPMSDSAVSSLNVSVAAGILLFEAVRQRSGAALV